MNGTNGQQERQKMTTIKTLAIIGFIVALVFLAWLAVQAVRLAPAGWGKLSSLVTGAKTETPEFTIATGANRINVGETLTVSWTRPAEEGEYSFSYQCADGVAAEIVSEDGNRSPIGCDTDLSLGTDVSSVAIVFSSEKNRYVDVSYTLSFKTANDETPYERVGTVTVVNTSLSANGVAEGESTTTEPTPDTNEPETPAPNTNTTRTPPVQYRTVPVTVTRMPVSNPNGYTDLAVTFIGVGTYNANTKIFTPKTSLREGERAALRFEVKNIGTKTSSEWYFNATLPTGTDLVFKSTANAPLKPNERQVITLQFDGVSENGDERVVVTVIGGDDAITANNSFSKVISITN
jgi:hypothetical protein